MLQLMNGSLFRKSLLALVLIAAGGLAASFVPKKVKTSGIRKVVIDPGHGGSDPGNLGTGRYKMKEKDVSLEVGLKLGRYIEKAFPDVEVVYTRKDDTFFKLHERTQIANKADADVFISIHCNANDNRGAYGSETYVMGLHKTEANLRIAQKENSSILLEEDYEQNYAGLDPTTPEGIIALSLRQNTFLDQSLYFSSLIQKQFRERVGRRDRGVKQAGFYVISFTTMPSVLVELGFLTNREEEDFLVSEIGQDYMASAIYRAFKQYKAEIESVDAESYNTIGESGELDTPETVAAPERIPDAEANKKPESKRRKGITFGVQLATTSAPVDPGKKFPGIADIQEFEVDGKFKYFAGAEKSYEKASLLLNDIRQNGYPGAFIVAFENGTLTNLKEAIERTKQ